MIIQFLLAKLPFGESVNHRLQRVNALRRGPESLQKRIQEVADGLLEIVKFMDISGRTIVEVGTGWDALPTLMLYSRGGAPIYTFDHLPHLRLPMVEKVCRALVESSDLEARVRLQPLVSANSKSLDEMLARTSILYKAPGDASKTGLPSDSVDLYYSYAVLEHVPDETALALINEAKRVLKPEGLFYALIGLHDHYHNVDRRVSKVNFLKYPEWLWAFLVKNNISYHNRLRERDFLEMLDRSGAEIVGLKSTIDPEDLAAVERMKIDRRFARFSPRELATTRTEIIARFPTKAG